MSPIFKRNFLIYTCSILLSNIVIAICLTQAYHAYYYEQIKTAMENTACKVSDIYSSAFENGEFNKEYFENSMSIIGQYMDYDFILIDRDKKIRYLSNDIDGRYIGCKLDIKDMDMVFGDKRKIYIGDMGGIFDDNVYTVGYPIECNGRIDGATLINSSLKNINEAMQSVCAIIAAVIIFATVIAFLLLFFSTRKNLKPILQMNEAAKIMAGGDFEKRIDADGDDEIAQLAKSFNDMAESLSIQNNSRSEYIANISHDLRSPITSIKGFLQAIIDGSVPEEKITYYLKIIYSETERLSQLVDNILLLNKLEYMGDDIVSIDFDINQLITETLLLFEEKIEEKNIDVDISFSKGVINVWADKEKIQRVLQNLFDNAIKFSHRYGKLIIRTGINGNKAVISVTDTGIGMDEKERKKAFERFYKADASRGKDKTGYGLGLSIVKKMIEAHGEKLTLKSEKGRGSEFEFSLPLYGIKK